MIKRPPHHPQGIHRAPRLISWLAWTMWDWMTLPYRLVRAPVCFDAVFVLEFLMEGEQRRLHDQALQHAVALDEATPAAPSSSTARRL